MIGKLRSTGADLKFKYLYFPAILKFQLQCAYADVFNSIAELDS